MLTSKAISTISYNTESYLLDTLNRLIKSDIICEWYYIKHKGEFSPYDDAREKDHIHLYIMPSKRIDTEILRDEFTEVDITNSKPLSVMPFQSSRQDDWLLYGIHDSTYLAKKGEIKEFAYKWTDVKGYDIDALKRACKHANDFNHKDSTKRQLIMQIGTANAYMQGILQSNEVPGAIAMERLVSTRDSTVHSQNNIISELREENERLAKELDKYVGFYDCKDKPFV